MTLNLLLLDAMKMSRKNSCFATNASSQSYRGLKIFGFTSFVSYLLPAALAFPDPKLLLKSDV